MFACSGDFKYAECPPGTEQNGGGDIDEACKPVAGGGGTGGVGTGGVGGGGGPSTGGSGGGGSAGSPPIPPGGECAPTTTRCSEGAQQTCGGDGKWGAAVTCDIGCDKAGVACVVPVQLAADSKHVCARLSDGTVRCWGSDEAESLGNGNGGNQPKPQAIADLEGVVDLDPTGHCARFEDKTAKCWGRNSSSRFDPSSTVATLPTPAPLIGAVGATVVAVGADHTCIIDGSGKVLCKGNNLFGVTGSPLGGPQPQYAPTSTSVQFTQIVAANSSNQDSNFALSKDGLVYCWGIASGCGGATEDCNPFGTPDTACISNPKPVPSVNGVRTLGQGFVPCAVGTDGRAQCWGQNHLGQLGRGTSGTTLLGAGPVSNLDAVTQVASGLGHVCAVREDSSLYCWGANSVGQLGATCGPSLPCQTYAPTNTSFVPNASKVPLDNVVEVRPAGAFTCARTADAKVYCWGDNAKGQLGDGTTGVGRAKPELVVWN
jgi:alpha-tubulin suppressor-like RCC1 family protein